jgi:8-oxo-dGTP pyrophosphatase MutT (NUDIX family)
METTRHFTATVYVVNDGATALHDHDRIDGLLPPGGHVDRDELPHEAGLREVREETGLEPTLLDSTPDLPAPAGQALPRPRHQLLYDINVHDGTVGHQHVDHVYYATVPSRELDPAEGEAGAGAWDWFTPTELRGGDTTLGTTPDQDTVEIGIAAIEAAATE